MKNKTVKAAAAALLFVLILTALFGCGQRSGAKIYASSRAELMKALAEGHEKIYVGDIEFDENDLYIEIRRGVEIIGKPGGSVLRKGVFRVAAPEPECRRIKVSFENVIFDGCYDMPEGDPASFASFADMHGDRTGKNCFTLSGQLDISFSDCTFRRYCSKYGATVNLIYSANDTPIDTNVNMTVDGCLFEKNISEKGIFWFNGKSGSESDLSITDTVFSENRAFTGVVTIGNVNCDLENVTVKNNIRTSYQKNTFYVHSGGGIHIAKSGLVMKNCTVDGCGAPSGGGMCLAACSALIDGCTFTNNSADRSGGALLVESSEKTPVYITNCFISGNAAEEEGAVYVRPADQINIGSPTGIVEFSFCTFENNRSNDAERFVFHAVATEDPEGGAGRSGKIGFYACRIIDEHVTKELKDGESGNMINRAERGEPIPANIVASAANGYYAKTGQKLYAGINKIEPPKDHTALLVTLLVLLFSALAALITVTAIRRVKERKKQSPGKPEEPARKPPENSPGLTSEDALSALAEEKKLTARELDVLREYLSGKTRTQMAESLFISESTVKNHISNIFSKLGVKSKEELTKLINR